MLKSVELKKLKPNPFRDERVDPIDPAVVDMLTESIRQFGFKSGGVTVRQMPNGDLFIEAGHHRVAAAIKAKIKEAVVEVEKTDDDTTARWLAQENATQRGQSSTAGAGSVIAAIMVLAPRIMRGEVDKLPPHRSDSSVGTPRKLHDLQTLQGNLAGDKGIGIDIICDFLHGIPGFTRASVRDYLAIVKGTGAYARTVSEIAARIEKEDAEADRKRQREVAEAERELATAQKREAEAETRKRASNERSERAKAERERKAAADARKKADKKKTAAADKRNSGASGVAERTRTAAAKHKPTLSEQVSTIFQNKEQVRVFFDAVSTIGTDVLPVNRQVELAQQIFERAANWPGRPREVSGTFIREQVSEIVFHAKHAARRADEAARKEASDRDYLSRATEMAHRLDRDMERFAIQGRKLAKLMDEHADVAFIMKDRVLANLERARELIDEFLDRAKRQKDPANVARLRLV